VVAAERRKLHRQRGQLRGPSGRKQHRWRRRRRCTPGSCSDVGEVPRDVAPRRGQVDVRSRALAHHGCSGGGLLVV
jgi:hypothetical protein